MNNTRNSVVILAKDINMDKEYQNIIDYTETEIVNLCTSQDHLVARQNNYSFLKVGENRISVGLDYNTCLSANYLCMQNPHYNNKWFFAFIDRVEYSSEKSTIIHYTVDEISTWWDYWSRKICFVEREHVNDDTVGLHTIPEGLETGDYISCKLQPTLTSNIETCFVVAVTELLNTMGTYSTFNQLLPIGLYYIGLTTLTGIQDLVKLYDSAGKGDAVSSVFVIPKSFFTTWTTLSGVDGNISYNMRFDYTQDFNITKVNYLGNDYVPVNNKLLTFPYSFLQVSNHTGQIVNYKWEYFNMLDVGTEGINFKLRGTITPGGSFKLFPVNYNNILNNNDDTINLGKYPIGAFNSDVYTNWLTQNGVNIGGIKLNAEQAGYALGGIQTAIGLGELVAGNPYGVTQVATGVGSILGTMQESYRHSLTPDVVEGNLNTGDVNFTFGINNFEFKRMSIKNEYARIIDNFWTRFGYKVNDLKRPNFTGRRYWNFVKIAGGEIIGYSTNNISVPESSMEIINKVFRNGTTIWHDHNNIGNYNLNNTIV